jgi:hypothetical protein
MMNKVPLAVVALIAMCATSVSAERLRFWNLTSVTISQLYLALCGTNNWSPDQCRNDPDGVVELDERLTLAGIEPGRYDVKLVDKTGWTCVVSNIEVKTGGPYAFSIEECDLKACVR